jgi:threonine dehydratase
MATSAAATRRMGDSIHTALRGAAALGHNRVSMIASLSMHDVQAAARRLLHRIHRTPVVSCQSFDDACGYQVFFKCENLQRAGAFKIRGALNKILTLTAEERERGVVAFSSGNHAQGVALAARLVGTTAVICMPKDAPRLKLEATRNYGGEVVFYDRHRDDREALARRIAEETKRVVVPPYDDLAIMAGQGTAALELFEDVPSLDALVSPVGGGGLMAGSATVARSLIPGIQVFGVETDTANDTFLSLRKGERVTIPPPPTIADGIRLTTPGALTFPILKERLTDVVLVSDADVRDTVRFLALRAHLVAEPTGAVAAAAVLAGKLALPRGARIGVIISGGNIDPELLIDILKS